jgi:hypothetical protein
MTELMIERPQQGRVTSQRAIERARELAAEGLRDDQIAKRLVSEGLQTGAKRSVILTATDGAAQLRVAADESLAYARASQLNAVTLDGQAEIRCPCIPTSLS